MMIALALALLVAFFGSGIMLFFWGAHEEPEVDDERSL